MNIKLENPDSQCA